MIIECPECGTNNQTAQTPNPDNKYRCGKCGASITFLQTIDIQDTLAEIPKEQAKTKTSRPLLLVLVFVILLAISLTVYARISSSTYSQTTFDKKGISFTIPEGWSITEENLNDDDNYISCEKKVLMKVDYL